MLEEIIDWIGYNGPFILVLLAILILLFSKNYLAFTFIYIIGVIINTYLNTFLKLIIRHPRPIENTLYNNNQALFSTSKTKADVFGMPSGHAQSVAFTTIFLYLVNPNRNVLLFCLIISLCTVFQRYIKKMHTINQLIIGYVIGLLVGWMFYMLGIWLNKLK